MLSTNQLTQLLTHRGSIFHLKEDYYRAKGRNPLLCPRCEGKGKYNETKSDCGHDRWTEVVTCLVCHGLRRVSKRYVLIESRTWEFTVNESGVHLDHPLKDRKIFLLKEDADAQLEALNAIQSIQSFRYDQI